MTTVFRYTSPLVARAALYLEICKLPFYVGYGKGTPWDSTWGTGINDANPPVPSNKLMELVDPLYYKRCVSVLPVIERDLADAIEIESCDEVEEGGSNWLVLDLQKTPPIILRDLDVQHLLVTCELQYEEAPANFRAFGLFVSPVPKENIASGLVNYLPEDLASPGLPIVFSHSSPVPPSAGNKFVNRFLIKV